MRRLHVFMINFENITLDNWNKFESLVLYSELVYPESIRTGSLEAMQQYVKSFLSI